MPTPGSTTATCVPTGSQGRPYQSASDPARTSKAGTLAVRSMTVACGAMVRITPRQMAVATGPKSAVTLTKATSSPLSRG